MTLAVPGHVGRQGFSFDKDGSRKLGGQSRGMILRRQVEFGCELLA